MKKALLVFAVALALAATAAAQPDIDYSLYDTGVSFAALRLKEVSDDGFVKVKDHLAEYEYKAEMFLPEKYSVFGLKPLNPWAWVVIRFRGIKGELRIQAWQGYEGLEEFPVEARVGPAGTGEDLYVVKDAEELTVWVKKDVLSFLGHAKAGPYNQRIIIVNDKYLNSAVFYVPKTRALLDFDGPESSFKLSEHAVFLHDFTFAGLIYYEPTENLLIQAVLALLFLGVVGLTVKWYDLLPRFDFRAKHLFVLAVVCGLLMMQLAAAIPNPRPTVITFGEEEAFGKAGLPYYLRFIVGLVDAVDAIAVVDDRWCYPEKLKEDRIHYLLTESADNVFVDEALKESPCIAEMAGALGEKVEWVGADELEALNKRYDFRRHPLGGLFGLSRRLIYALFMALGFFSTGALFLRAFEVRHVMDWLAYGMGSFAYVMGVQAWNLTVGFVARMAVTYHGTSSLPLTMSAKLLPIFNQAHNLRFGILILGVISTFVFSKRVREQTSVRLFLLPMLLFGLLLVTPYTEFSAKTLLTTFACGECGVYYRGKLDVFNLQRLYAGLRGNADLEQLFSYEDVETFNRALVFERQEEREKAIEAFRAFILENPDSGKTADAYYHIGNLYWELKDREEDAERYRELQEKGAEAYERMIAFGADETMLNQAIGRVPAYYQERNANAKAAAFLEGVLPLLGNPVNQSESLRRLYELYEKMGEKEKARAALESVIALDAHPSHVAWAEEKIVERGK